MTLHGLTPAESDAVSALMEEYWQPGRPAVIFLRRLEQRLAENAFGGGIRDMLELLDGRPVAIRAERDRQRSDTWLRILENAAVASGLAGADRREGPYLPLIRWLEQLGERTASGGRSLRALAELDPVLAERQLSLCLTALMDLIDRQASEPTSGAVMRLPVFAAFATGDSHAFDWKEPLGRLLVGGMQAVWGREESRGVLDEDDGMAEGALLRRELYRSAGIADDDISSQVIFCAMSGTGEWEEQVLTLRQVERLRSLPCVARIYAVENPSLFGAFLDRGLSGVRNDAMIVCVNGYPSSATLRWLDLCLASQDDIQPLLLYAGDLDVKGLEIAAFLLRRYGDRFRPWRMSTLDYESASVRGMALSDAECSRLERMSVSWDSELIPVMLRTRNKVYQELLIEPLWQDMIPKADSI